MTSLTGSQLTGERSLVPRQIRLSACLLDLFGWLFVAPRRRSFGYASSSRLDPDENLGAIIRKDLFDGVLVAGLRYCGSD